MSLRPHTRTRLQGMKISSGLGRFLTAQGQFGLFDFTEMCPATSTTSTTRGGQSEARGPQVAR